MIPVIPQPEPPSFQRTVRQPGLRFLRERTSEKWDGGTYWTRALPDLRRAYNEICCYCAEWIPSQTGNSSVDHFEPKSTYPELAYEWSNFRHSAARLNSRKRETRGILDPFLIGPNWFTLDFPSVLIKPGAALPIQHADDFNFTITTLRLNDELSVESRVRWLRNYCLSMYNFEFLRQHAPFIASELERQGLINEIRLIMNF